MSTPLREPAFRPLPTGRIRPRGWLLGQLRAQAEGLTGKLDGFWPSIRDSAWIGGPDDGWERGPYWLDGLIPLAHQLGDEALLAKAQRWVDAILAGQHADGWLGPLKGNLDPASARRDDAYDPWPRFVVLKALLQHADATADARVQPAVERFLRRLHLLLQARPLEEWAHPRWPDLVLACHWLHERTGETWPLALAALARAQGLDWRAWAERFPYRGRIDVGVLHGFQRRAGGRWINDDFSATHGVNVAMGLKAGAVAWRETGDDGDRRAVGGMLAALDAWHGQATGLWSCDEHLAGPSPSQGTELCTVVEAMFSLEVALSVLGDPALADRLERIAFNALPATIWPDWWTHQYDQQANQVRCAHCGEDRVWTNNGPDANLFGLEPNFGCCTANMHQGWPKLVAHAWMRAPDGTLAAMTYAPVEVAAAVDGVPLTIAVHGGYPFAEEVVLRLRAPRAVRVPLALRIPGWAEGATVDGAAVVAGGFHRCVVAVDGEATVRLRLPAAIRSEPRFNGAVSVARGPLVYAVAVPFERRQLRGAHPEADHELHPTGPWNWAIDPASLVAELPRTVPAQPFVSEAAPLRLRAQARRLPQWGLHRGAADLPPPSPARSDAPLESVELLPYGCTKLRVTEIPVLG